jgi:hypothetical protein
VHSRSTCVAQITVSVTNAEERAPTPTPRRLQRPAGAGRLEGEPDDKTLLQRMSQEFAEASDCFSKNKLLMSPELMRRIDEFFSKMLSAGIDLRLTFEPGMQGEPRAQLWDQARTIAYKDLPSILEAIRSEARAAIHG